MWAGGAGGGGGRECAWCDVLRARQGETRFTLTHLYVRNEIAPRIISPPAPQRGGAKYTIMGFNPEPWALSLPPPQRPLRPLPPYLVSLFPPPGESPWRTHTPVLEECDQAPPCWSDSAVSDLCEGGGGSGHE